MMEAKAAIIGVVLVFLGTVGFGLYQYGRLTERIELGAVHQAAIAEMQEHNIKDMAAYADALVLEMKNYETLKSDAFDTRDVLNRMQINYRVRADALSRAEATPDNCEASRVLLVGMGILLDRAKQRGTELLLECDLANGEIIEHNKLLPTCKTQ